ncbi:MAG: hypothetical protein EOO77_41620 [Oxalobacteraceae bacterium]|nr:MAG: hypothetical protein EOO77_41620 [Oxalobacteraceae bacterium]
MFHIYGNRPGGTWALVASSSTPTEAVSHYSAALRLFPFVMIRNPAGDTIDLPCLMRQADMQMSSATSGLARRRW